jgi:predicted Rossmann fold flavoprotein
MIWDVIILGAGAAGMMAAIEAGRRGRRVLIIDHAKSPGEKIRISGGGRCNFTNLNIAPERFLSQNPRFALSALKRFTQWDFIARMDAAGIAWHEKTLGQLFCDGPATQVVAMLVRDMEIAGVTLWLDCALGEVRRVGEEFEVDTARGPQRARSVVVATGGKSIPKMGATGYGYRVAEAFSVPLVETRPALVPLTFAEQELSWMRPLAGVALAGRVTCGRTGFDEAVLFTHRGLSGPAILQISSYWREGEAISVDLLPGRDIGAELRGARGKLALRLLPVGSEGFRTAEVTLGGVDTAALDGRTMEARGVPGLYFIGEVVDVTGWLGGYNFQWAWSSGWAAGQAV